MNPLFLATALLSSLASADLGSDISAVNSAASVLGGKVENWNSKSGLLAALGIQGYYPTLSNAVNTMSKDIGSASASDIDVDTINSFASSVTTLLDDLTQKAKDFQSVGAGTIVRNDINQLSTPASDIIADIVQILSGDCEKVSSLTGALNDVSNGFSSAISAYGGSQVAFAAPSC